MDRVMLMIYAAIFLLLITSCNTEKKALNKTQLYLFKHPEFSAGYCAKQFPDKPDSVIIKYDTVLDVWQVVNDSLIKVTDSVYFDTSACKPKIIIKKITITRDSIIYRENRAEQERLQLSLLEANKNVADLIAKNTVLEKDRDLWKSRARKRGWEFWGLLFIVVGAIGMRIYIKSKKILA